MMTRYVQAIDGKFIRHINDIEPTQWDADNFCSVSVLSPEQRSFYGIFPLVMVSPPAWDWKTQSLEEGPAELIDGQWQQIWIIRDFSDAEKADLLNIHLDRFNANRAAKLAATDWWAIRASGPGGVPMTEEQLAYRQALRVMDDAEDFDPFNPQWPAEPGA